MIGSLWFNSFSSGGGAAAYELISTTVLGSSQASVTFNLSSAQRLAYKHLQVRYVGNQSANEFNHIQFNGATSTYYSHTLEGNGSTVTSSNGWTGVYCGTGYYASGMVNTWICDILDPFSTTKNKTTRALGGRNAVYLASGGWFSTAEVTSVTVGMPGATTFGATSRFSLYGIRGA